MRFLIFGTVRERESGLGVPNLTVRFHDKDLLFDDLLGTAVTDASGKFEVRYEGSDFRELFDRRPDIYASVYAPPSRLLVDTKHSVRWGASDAEEFTIEIDRDDLGDLAPSRPDHVVTGSLSLTVDDLVIEHRDGFDIPGLPGFTTGGVPGAPALPELIQFAALPLGADVQSIEVRPGEAVAGPGGMNPLPAQEPFPDVGTDADDYGDGVSVDNIHFEFTPADQRTFEGHAPYPETLVEIVGSGQIGPVQFVAVRINPIQFDPADRSFRFFHTLRYDITFEAQSSDPHTKLGERRTFTIGAEQAKVVQALLDSDRVFSAKELYSLLWVVVPEQVPYVIITDKFAWPASLDRGDGTTRAPTLSERGSSLNGDLVAEFERLAHWKTTRGTYTRVVTISDIVDGRYGDFTESGFARDLQEVIRNFTKMAHGEWKTQFLLLGGDVHIVPMRNLVGCSTYKTIGVGRKPVNPPTKKKCYYVTGGSVVKARPLFTPHESDPLATLNGGLRIPFDREAGSGRLGWYFTTESDFANKDAGFTRLPAGQRSHFVIVEGPDAVIDDSYYWVRTVNSIPSDFYYASLVGPGYSLDGRHDFDSNNNGLYGQYHGHTSLDQIDMVSDIWVGRAPVDSGDDARTVVDKILTYERMETPAGEAVDPAYLQKVIYGSAYWDRAWQWRQVDTTIPPAAGRFTHEAGATTALARTDLDLVLSGALPDRRLVARHATEQTVVPYDHSGPGAGLGWYFTTDDGFETHSTVATRFILIHGTEAEVDAVSFFWDPIGLKGAMGEKETLRSINDGNFPAFTSVDRHYEDYFDLASPPPIVPLESATIREAIDDGVHFLSLSGHGSNSGCCEVSAHTPFTNQHQSFIAFANSCSTARSDDVVDSLGEKCLTMPDGGAIAYVGNTRYGWIGIGDNFEEFFWIKLRIHGSAGEAAGLRLGSGGVENRWTSYTQTLYGDPEMPVWTDTPREQQVAHPEVVPWGGVVEVSVSEAGSPVSDHRVTLMGGWTGSAAEPRVLMSTTTQSNGIASFALPSSGTAPAELSVAVTHTNRKPYIGTIVVTTDV